MKWRTEADILGKLKIPFDAYWGIHTQRTANTFAISQLTLPEEMIKAIGLIKKCSAEVNVELKLIPSRIGRAIIKASEEVIKGKFNSQFITDVFQTGSGTAFNMNANEVIANRANEILGYPKGKKHPVHPNDHVNRCQSSNDVIPSAIHIALRLKSESLLHHLQLLTKTLMQKRRLYRNTIKLGRTHLQDAVPMTFGDELSGYATQLKKCAKRLKQAMKELEELPLGGTAVGTGINAHPEFGKKVIKRIAEITGVKFRECENRFESISSKDSVVNFMGVLNTLAVSLMKIANDLRLLSSGPYGGIGEIFLPPIQPGSSIMPGKINPVVCEMMLQVCAEVMGNTMIIAIGGTQGPLQLNIMMPLIAYKSIFSLKILTNAIKVFTQKCIKGMKAYKERMKEYAESSPALITPFASKIGYDRASKIALRALREKRKILELLVETGLLSSRDKNTFLKQIAKGQPLI